MNRELAETLLAQLIADELDPATRADLLAYLKTDTELSETLGDMRMAAGLLHEGLNAGDPPALRSAQRAALDALLASEPLPVSQQHEQPQPPAPASDAAGGDFGNGSPVVLFTLRGAGAAAACLAIGVGTIGLLTQTSMDSPTAANFDSASEPYLSQGPSVMVAESEILEQGLRDQSPRPHFPPQPTRPYGISIHTDQSASADWNGSVLWNDNHVDFEQRETINTPHGSVTRNPNAPASGLLALAESSRETTGRRGGRGGGGGGGGEGLFGDVERLAEEDGESSLGYVDGRFDRADRGEGSRYDLGGIAGDVIEGEEAEFFSFGVDLPFDQPDAAAPMPPALANRSDAPGFDLSDALSNTNTNTPQAGELDPLFDFQRDRAAFNHSAAVNPGLPAGQQGQTNPEGWLADPISESQAAQTLGRALDDAEARGRFANGHADDEVGVDRDLAFNTANTDTLLNIDTDGDGNPDATDGLPDNGSRWQPLDVRGVGPSGRESAGGRPAPPQEPLAEADDDLTRLRSRLEGESRREGLANPLDRGIETPERVQPPTSGAPQDRSIARERADAAAAASAERFRTPDERQAAIEADRAQREEVQRLLHSARELQLNRNYDQALQALEAAEFLDPDNPAVTTLQEIIADVSVGVEAHNLQRDLDLMRSNHQLINDEAVIPYDELLTYPGDWPELTQMRLAGLDAEAGDVEANRTAELSLRRIVDAEFDSVELGDVIDYIRDTTGANIAVNWPALELSGIDQDTPISLTLSRLPAEQMLRLAIEQAGAASEGDEKLGYRIVEGIVTVSRLADLKSATETRVYDIRDLLNEDEFPGATREEAIEQFIQLIHETVGDANEWLYEESTVRELNGNFIIKSTPENHRAVLAVLNLMRGEAADEESQPATPPTNYPVNPWVLTQDDALSTFAVDVDTASYQLARRHIVERGQLPAASSIRMEEFVNRFDYNYPAGHDAAETFRVHLEAGPAPFADAGIALVKVGVRGRVVARDQQKPAHLVFVIDASGSMAREDRLPLVQRSLAIVLEQLGPEDTVSLVSYDTAPYLLVEHASASDPEAILDAAASIQTRGSTNLIDGMRLGYQVAARHFAPGSVNRVILCSDGVANVGSDDAEGMLDAVSQYREHGISLTTLGVGIDEVGQTGAGFNDHLLEQLANRGDGRYLYLGSVREAHRLLATELAASAPIIARDVKIQVAFDPARVRRYRLIGYENRAIADADFRNDSVDAGEVYSGQSATALYEVELYPTPGNPALGNRRGLVAGRDAPVDLPADELGTVFVRYHDTRKGQVEETQCTLHAGLLRERTPRDDPRFFLAACAAEFAERLRESEHGPGPGVGSGSDDALLQLINAVAEQLPLDSDVAELKELIGQSRGLPRAQ